MSRRWWVRRRLKIHDELLLLLLYLIETKPETFYAPWCSCSYVCEWFAQDYWNENKINRQPWNTTHPCHCMKRTYRHRSAAMLHIQMFNDVAIQCEYIHRKFKCHFVVREMFIERSWTTNECLWLLCKRSRIPNWMYGICDFGLVMNTFQLCGCSSFGRNVPSVTTNEHILFHSMENYVDLLCSSFW